MINVKSFGAKGDGVTDDLVAIRNAIATWKEKGGTLIFPPGVYMQGDGIKNKKPSGYNQNGIYNDGTGDYPRYDPIDGVAYPYYVKNNVKYPIGDFAIGEDLTILLDGIQNAEIIGYGATIKAHTSNSCIKNNAGLVFTNCENLTSRGLTYDGSISERQPFLSDTGNFNEQDGISLRSNCTNLVFEDVTSTKCVMDGWQLHSMTLKDITLRNCKGIANYRQGVTIGVADNVLIEGGVYADQGTIYGILPMSGIDLEPETGLAENVTIRKAKFYGNIGHGIGFTKKSVNSTVEDCYFNGNMLYEGYDNVKNNNFRKNRFINASLDSYGGGTYIDDNIFEFSNVTGTYYTSILSDDTSNYYKLGLCRKGRVSGNSIVCDLTGISDAVNVLGVMPNLGADINDITNNTLINSFSKNSTAVVGGKPSLFSKNKLSYTGALSTAGSVCGGTINEDNEVSSKYSVVAKNEYYRQSKKSQKTFFLSTAITPDKCVDITLGNRDIRGTTFKLTFIGNYNTFDGLGYFEEWIKCGWTGNFEKTRRNALGNNKNYVIVSTPRIKNGINTITIKGISNELGGVINVEVFSPTTPYTESEINISNSYTYTMDLDSIMGNKTYVNGSVGSTGQRPTTSTHNISTGDMFYDTTIMKPIFWNGTEWTDSTGTAV
ncbi:glycosyl hydrolase family 28-related protein [Peribacillus frigoritolerans]|uniref:glycosyl hydrolase family 28-related protein n=1 Tax=Peribacillus frigoritolerans TaxID=450367 RepID=UPI00351740C0